MKKDLVRNLVLIILGLIAVSLILSMKFTLLESFQVVFGTIFVLFIPGLVWSYVFYTSADSSADTNADVDADRTLKNKLSWTERIILSFGLSAVMSPLFAFLLSKVGIKITALTCFVEIMILIVAGLAILIITKIKKKEKIFSILGSERFDLIKWLKANKGVLILLILLVLLLFHYYYGIFKFDYPVPSGDDPTRHMTQAQSIMENGYTQAWKGSLDPPLFHVLLSELTFLTTGNIVSATLYIVPLFFILSYFALYYVAKRLFKNEALAILAIVLLMFLGKQPDFAFSLGTYLNLFAGLTMFLFGLSVLPDLLKKKELDWRKISLAVLFFAGVFLTHSLSTAYAVLTLGLVFVLALIFKLLCKYNFAERFFGKFNVFFKNYFVFALVLLILVVPLTHDSYLNFIFNRLGTEVDSLVGQEEIVDSAQGLIHSAIPWFSYENFLTIIICVLALISLPFFLRFKNQISAKIIVISWALAILIGSKYEFFILPYRFALDLVYPLIIIIAFFFVISCERFSKWKSLFIRVILVLMIVIAIPSFIIKSVQYNTRVRLQEPDLKAIAWIDKNVCVGETILVYPKTLALRGWGSYVNILTGRKVIDGSDCPGQQKGCAWIFDPESPISENFYKENDIDYVYAGKKVLGYFEAKNEIDWNYQDKMREADFLDEVFEYTDKTGTVKVFKVDKSAIE